MTKQSIMNELSSYVPQSNKEMFIEGQAVQLISSAQHLITLLDKTYQPELADELKRRLLTAIKNNDTEKFCRRVRKIRELKAKGDTNGSN